MADNSNKAREVRYIYDQLKRLDVLAFQFERGLSALAVTDDMLREILVEMPEQLDRLERAILDLSHPDDKEMRQITNELRQEMYQSRIDSLKRQLLKQYKNKNTFEEQSAEYGGSPPVYLTNQINKTVENIGQIEQELEYFKDLLNG